MIIFLVFTGSLEKEIKCLIKYVEVPLLQSTEYVCTWDELIEGVMLVVLLMLLHVCVVSQQVIL